VHCCVLFSRPSRVKVRVRVRIRFSVWLVSCYAHVFVLLQVVIVALPIDPASVATRWTWVPLAQFRYAPPDAILEAGPRSQLFD